MSLNGYHNSTPGSANGISLGVEAIREFSVMPAGYSAQYGRAAGGILNAVTRSGGNSFHGSTYYFHRNDNLDARNFFDPGPLPEFRRHQFGGALGGPISRNRAFFFVNYEALREQRGDTAVNTTLSDRARRGELAGGTVPIDPDIAPVLDLFPSPNGAVLGDTGLFLFPNDVHAREDFLVSRVDWNASDFDRLFFRYNFDDAFRGDQTNFAAGRRENRTRPQSGVAEYLRVFSPSVLNTARFGVARGNTAAGRTVTLNPATDNPAFAFLPNSQVIGVLDVTGLSEFPGGTGAQDADLHAFTSFQLSDDVSWTTGRHSLRFGGRLERTRFNTNSQSRVSGEYRFQSLADFLGNRPDRFRAQFPESDTVRGFRQWIGALYAQDAWHLGERLTLELGLRWEIASVPREVNGKEANLDSLLSPAPRVGPLFENPSWTNFSPRLGLAWDVHGTGSTIVRAGYGVYPDLILSHFLLLAGVRNPPFFMRGSTRRLQTGDFPEGGYQRFLEEASADLRVEWLERHPRQPYVQHWNLRIEQRLDQHSVLRLAYVGSHGLNLSSVIDDANLVEPVLLPDGRRYYPEDGEKVNSNFSAIRKRAFDAHSFYHGLQVRFERRLSRGVQLQGGYAFSKSMDDSSSVFATTEAANAGSSPVNDTPRFNRALSDYDQRHSFTLAGIWELPVNSRRWGWLLDGWQLAGIATYSSGIPLSAWLGYDGAGTKANRADRRSGQRPDLAPGATNNPVTGRPGGWVDLSAFLRPQGGFLGNLGRNTIIGPDLANVDLSLVKRFRPAALGEAGAVEFRFEFFNLANRTNLDIPSAKRLEIFTADGVREDAGRVTSAGASREIQFGVKVRF